MNRQQEQRDSLTVEQGFNLAYFAANAGFWTVAPFLRSGIGKRAGGLSIGASLFALLWYAGSQRSEAMLFYFWSWVGMLMYRWLTPGKGVVSAYQGFPYTTAWLVRDEMLARILEAIVVWVAGHYVMPHSQAMGKFLVWVSVLLGVKCGIEHLYLRRAKEAIEDEIIIMKSRMEDMKRR